LDLAGRVGPTGEVVGVDIAPTMLARANQRAKEVGATNVEFVEADVQVQELGEPSTFDVAFSRFGVMFFSDPVAAFRNVHRALKPGGVLGFACWQDIVANEWLSVPGQAIMSVTGQVPPMPSPEEPGPFSLADPLRVEGLLRAAGFDDIEVLPHSQPVVLNEAGIENAAQFSIRGAERVALRDADDDTRQRALAAVREAFRSRLINGEVRLPGGVLLAKARA
jgi:SAM-dependent methyltransferase